MADKSYKKIDESDLKKVSGGYVFDTKQLLDNPDERRRYESLDSKGNVLARFATEEEAKIHAQAYGQSTTSLTWEQLQRLRETGSPY